MFGTNETLYVYPKVELNMRDIEYAAYSVNQYGLPEVKICLTKTGAMQMVRLTKANAHKRLAILFHGHPRYAPVIDDPSSDVYITIGGINESEVRMLVGELNKK
jgi:preprotein translocase subunit SecD